MVEEKTCNHVHDERWNWWGKSSGKNNRRARKLDALGVAPGGNNFRLEKYSIRLFLHFVKDKKHNVFYICGLGLRPQNTLYKWQNDFRLMLNTLFWCEMKCMHGQEISEHSLKRNTLDSSSVSRKMGFMCIVERWRCEG